MISDLIELRNRVKIMMYMLCDGACTMTVQSNFDDINDLIDKLINREEEDVMKNDPIFNDKRGVISER